MTLAGAAAPGCVLLVEDNPADSFLVREAIEDVGDPWPTFPVVEAGDLRSALVAIDEHRPVCVLLDLGLPDTNDLDGLEEVVATHPDVPVVVLTGRDDPVSAQRAIRAGAQDYLVKDADPNGELLIRTIGNAMQRAAAARALVDSNERLTSFASMVAHDLRGPMSIAIGMLQVLELKGEGELSDDLSSLVTRSMGALDRTMNLVDSLLMYARAKHAAAAVTEIDIGECARWAADAVFAAPNGVVVEIADDLPVVRADQAAIRQVLQNLLSNAIAYAHPDRPAEIQVEAARVDDEWRITVADNGIGIPPEARELVFNEGERLDQGGDGFGLGLPAVRAAIERLGGSVAIEDGADDLGTTVVLYLPVADAG